MTALRPERLRPAAAENAAAAAWQRYGSTVRLGGTPEQRRWAFDLALRAERACQKLKPLLR